MIQRLFFGGEYSSWDAGLLATDISDRSLRTALQGRYPKSEVDVLPVDWRRQFFRSVGDEYEVTPELKRDVTYRSFNLKKPNYSFKRPFDIVFVRNVLIYFDVPTKHDVIRKIASQMNPGGYVFVGLAESLGRETGPVKYVRPGVYKKLG
jgi:chemotaxis protein methyltransferase CheR